MDKLAHWFESVRAQLPAAAQWPENVVLEAVSGDASFRVYYRARAGTHSVILMDAPPARESSEQFVRLARLFAGGGVNVPRIHACDIDLGFVCLEDFGDCEYWDSLNEARDSDTGPGAAGSLYHAAFEQLLKIQRCTPELAAVLPPFDETLLRGEMALFTDWLCRDLLQLSISPTEWRWMQSFMDALIASAHEQTRVCVHRDYHSRNLMYRPGEAPGVLDFQDAVLGPLTYDLVSLLKDCYIAWPRERVLQWAREYRALVLAADIVPPVPEADFIRHFELMGIQRHMKAAGIFARLSLRDGKRAYLKDIPRTLAHIEALGNTYDDVPGFREFQDWLQARVKPAMTQRLLPMLERSA